MKRLATLAMLSCLLGQSRAASATWLLDTEATVIYDDNVGLAQRARDVKSDTALSALASVGWGVQLDDRSLVSLTLDAGGKLYERFTGLDHVVLGLTPAFKHKLGLGPEAPSVRLWGSVARQEYEEDIRDSWVYRLGAGIGKRFGARWELRADYTFERRLGDDDTAVSTTLPGDVFDLTSHTFAFRSDFLYSQALSLFAGYALRTGDVVSTTTRNPQIFGASTALTRDRAFGRNFVAYKIDATAHVLGVGGSLALGQRASFNVGYEHVIGEARRGIEYRNNIVRMGLLYSF